MLSSIATMSVNRSYKPSLLTCNPHTFKFTIPTAALKFNHASINTKIRRNPIITTAAAAAEAIKTDTPLQSQKLGVVVKPMEKTRLVLKFIWMEKNIGIALDQVIPGYGTIPVSPYYFWPRKDAWEELKIMLEKWQ
nr:30S ribosomal protein 3, chloroplastic-like [Tanacetum cinerariifolium]